MVPTMLAVPADPTTMFTLSDFVRLGSATLRTVSLMVCAPLERARVNGPRSLPIAPSRLEVQVYAAGSVISLVSRSVARSARNSIAGPGRLAPLTGRLIRAVGGELGSLRTRISTLSLYSLTVIMMRCLPGVRYLSNDEQRRAATQSGPSRLERQA